MIDFRAALSVMSKSSPYAVSTERHSVISTDLDTIKKYIYVETTIEKDFEKKLTALSSTDKKIIFLCGSSGDGKSEILTKFNKDYSNRADFHLDATHSFRPSDSAIQTLDELFTKFECNSKPLVVGINTGMLGNYAQEGKVLSVTESIKAFLDKTPVPDNYIFLDFEDYPKFTLTENGHIAEFAQDFIQKITAADKNILRQYYDKELISSNPDKMLCANYRLLEREDVQAVIIDMLFKARLIKDQFLTARGLLDFIFQLLAGPGYLFDNLFKKNDNELIDIISDFDPAMKRTHNVDKFILSYSLQLPDEGFTQFNRELEKFGITDVRNSESYLRLFYLLKSSDFSNGYHLQFKNDFEEDLIDKYSKIWHIHSKYNGSYEQKEELRSFYRDTAIAAIRKYNNRNAPKLSKKQFFISENNGFFLTSTLEIKHNLNKLPNPNPNTSSFTAYFRIGNETRSLMININLLHLMERIVAGYRPNKHDKNTIVLLDELIDEISEIANGLDTLTIIGKNNEKFEITNADDDFEVSKL